MFHADVVNREDTPETSARRPPLHRSTYSIAFASAREGSVQIHAIDGDGAGLRRITDLSSGGADFPAWSPSGAEIAFIKQGPEQEVCVVNADGRNLRILGNSPALCPAWSPDGSQIAFMSYREGDGHASNIYVMPVDGSATCRITAAPGSHEAPAWWPGDEILYSFQPSDGAWQVNAMSPDGSRSRRVTPPGVMAVSASWSPDRGMVAFVALGTPGNFRKEGIGLCGDDGSGLRPLAGTEPGDTAPVWTPDGHGVIFVRGTSIYRAELDGSGVHHVADGVYSAFLSVTCLVA